MKVCRPHFFRLILGALFVAATFLPACFDAYLNVDAIATIPKYVLNINSSTDTVVVPFVYYRVANLDAQGSTAGRCEDMVATFQGKNADLTVASATARNDAGVFYIPSNQTGRAASSLFADDPSMSNGKLVDCYGTFVVRHPVSGKPGANNQTSYVLSFTSKTGQPSENARIEFLVTRRGNPSGGSIPNAPMVTTGVVDDVLRQLQFTSRNINTARLVLSGSDWKQAAATWPASETRYFVNENPFITLSEVGRSIASDAATIDVVSTGTMQARLKTDPAALSKIVSDPSRTAIMMFTVSKNMLADGGSLQTKTAAATGSEGVTATIAGPLDPASDDCSVPGNCDDGTGSGDDTNRGTGGGTGGGTGAGNYTCTSGPVEESSACSSCVGLEGGTAVTIVDTNGTGSTSDDEFFTAAQSAVTTFWNANEPVHRYSLLTLRQMTNYNDGSVFSPSSIMGGPEAILRFKKAFFYGLARLLNTTNITQADVDGFDRAELQAMPINCPIICCLVAAGFASSGLVGEVCPPPSPSPSPSPSASPSPSPTITFIADPTFNPTVNPTVTVAVTPIADPTFVTCVPGSCVGTQYCSTGPTNICQPNGEWCPYSNMYVPPGTCVNPTPTTGCTVNSCGQNQYCGAMGICMPQFQCSNGMWVNNSNECPAPTMAWCTANSCGQNQYCGAMGICMPQFQCSNGMWVNNSNECPAPTMAWCTANSCGQNQYCGAMGICMPQFQCSNGMWVNNSNECPAPTTETPVPETCAQVATGPMPIDCIAKTPATP